MSRLVALEHRVLQLSRLCERLLARQATTDDRMDKMVRHGKVTDVDTQKQLARIELASKDGTVTKSDWRPYAQFAGPDGEGDGNGALKVHAPPTVGQQMTMFSPNGEWRQGVIMPFTWYDKAKAPSQGADPVITYGKVTVALKKDQATISVGETTWDLTASTGTMKATTIVLDSSDIRLGGAGASRPLALRDTITTDGASNISNLSTSVKAI